MNIVIDLNNIYHRAYAVVSGYDGFDLEQKRSQYVLGRKCITDIMSIIQKLNFSVEKDKVFICMDGINIFRKNIDSDYKANRTRKKEEFYNVLNEVYNVLFIKGFNVIQIQELEADDLLCLFSESLDSKELTILVSNDKDVKQLVDDNIVVYTANSLNNKIFCKKDEYDIVSFYLNELADLFTEIDPEFIKFEKILLGDSGDNVPKLLPKGVGTRRVSNMYDKVKSYKNIENLIGVDLTNITSEQLKHQEKLVILSSENMPDKCLKEFNEKCKNFINKPHSLNFREVIANTFFDNII